MKKAKLVLANFDARIPNIKIKPNNERSKVTISSKLYNEATREVNSVKIHFTDVVAIDFRINLFDSMVGAEACGLYCIKSKKLAWSIVEDIFNRRKEIYLLEYDYNYDENDEHDMLNCLDLSDKLKNNLDKYKVYIQNVDAGVYIIVAKKMKIEE